MLIVAEEFNLFFVRGVVGSSNSTLRINTELNDVFSDVTTKVDC